MGESLESPEVWASPCFMVQRPVLHGLRPVLHGLRLVLHGLCPVGLKSLDFGPKVVRREGVWYPFGRLQTHLSSRYNPGAHSFGVHLSNHGVSGRTDLSIQGNQGSTGLQGVAGPKGDPGAKGAQGTQGLTGPKGDTGATGLKGEAGATGPKGPRGLTGLRGVPGPKGDDGAEGKGLRGPIGSRGAPGPKGDTGAKGEQGPQGYPGPKGATSVNGVQRTEHPTDSPCYKPYQEESRSHIPDMLRCRKHPVWRDRESSFDLCPSLYGGEKEESESSVILDEGWGKPQSISLLHGPTTCASWPNGLRFMVQRPVLHGPTACASLANAYGRLGVPFEEVVQGQEAFE
ncbi:hypothetical protein EDB81DRAFT_860321 [Dactylonectria macrodidyma]|uniref:Uncharacterized protein n=1 Tax=Dactylonectria macrodidyma TaxID=307937 RepID=A0A9P9IQG4_9HYPO|nr:hypothetical protein EDB81DRAFT_860321 [Dactylonectria macrodidyma]